MNIAQVALRNLSRQKKRSSLLAIAVGFGILIITVVNGFVNGAVKVGKDNIAQLQGGHVYLSMQKLDDDREIDYVPDESKLLDALHSLKIDDSQLLRRSELTQQTGQPAAQLIFNGETVNQDVIGVDWKNEKDLVAGLRLSEGKIEDLSANPEAIALGEKTAKRLKLKLGDEVLVKAMTVTGQQNVLSFVVAGIIEGPGLFSNLAAYAGRDYVNALINIPTTSYQTLTVKLKDPQNVAEYDSQLRTILAKSYTIKAPDDPNAQQSFIMKTTKREHWDGLRVTIETIATLQVSTFLDTVATVVNAVGLGVLVMMLLITMIGVINTFRMIMYERVQEIGTLRAMGMQKNTVGSIMVMEAVFLSLAGVIAGTLLAAIVMGLLSVADLGTASAISIFLQNGHLSFALSPLAIIANTVVVAFLTLLAALIPATKAAGLQPADALRAVY